MFGRAFFAFHFSEAEARSFRSCRVTIVSPASDCLPAVDGMPLMYDGRGIGVVEIWGCWMTAFPFLFCLLDACASANLAQSERT